ncbi:unnamed protein product [Alopecurus aequalis]
MADDDASPKKFLATQPPAHLPDGADEGGGEGYPSLLNLQVYVANRRNATTASCDTEGGGGRRIQLTICAARPPQISYLCVCCPGLDPDVFAAPPYIVATEADLLLLAVVFGPYSARHEPENYEYYLYQAAAGAGGAALLQPIPRPHGTFVQVLSSPVTGILRYSTNNPERNRRPRRRSRKHKGSNFILRPHDGHHQHGASDSYIIAAVSYTDSSNQFSQQFELHVYYSRTKTWSNKLVLRDHDRYQQPFRLSHKVITIGGDAGTMAWVDLWNGILFYDLLRQDTEDGGAFGRYVPLPPTPLRSDQLDGCPLGERDIALINGRISYIELQTHVRSSKLAIQHHTYVSYGWTAFMWSRSATDPQDSWCQDCKLKASEVFASGDNMLPNVESLPRLEDDDEGEPRPLLARLHCGHPTLSLHDDEVFYLMNKIDFRDEKAWVLAVDTGNKRLRAVAEFIADRVGGFSFTYRHTRLSEYLNTAPDPEGGLKRPLEEPIHLTRTMQSVAQDRLNSPQVEGGEEMELE